MTIVAKIGDVEEVVTVSPETTVVETARRMVPRGVSAVPVVDADNRPLGVVSEGDVMRLFGANFQNRRAQWLRMLAEGETLARRILAAVARLEKEMTAPTRLCAPAISAKAFHSDLSNALMQPTCACYPARINASECRADVLGAVVGNLQGVLEMTD